MLLCKLVERCVQVPLLAGPATLGAYRAFAAGDPPAAIMAGYHKAQAVVAARSDLEAAVAAGKPADMDLLASYTAYVKLEQVCGRPFSQPMAFAYILDASCKSQAGFKPEQLSRVSKLLKVMQLLSWSAFCKFGLASLRKRSAARYMWNLLLA